MPRVVIPITDIKPQAAMLTTALTGANNDLVFTAVNPGAEGNSIRIAYIVAGNNTPLTVTVDGLDITVNVATGGGGAATSTAAQVLAALKVEAVVRTLIGAALAASNNGTGIVVAFSFANLTGGSLGVDASAQVTADATNKHYFGPNDGQVYLEVVSTDGSARTVTIKTPSSLSAAGTGADRVETIAAGATKLLGPFAPARHNQDATNSRVYVDPSVATTLKFRCYRLTKVN